MPNQPVIGEILLRAGVVEPEALGRALEVWERDGGSLGRILDDLGLAGESSVARALAEGLGLEMTDLEILEIPLDVAALLPAAFCRRRRVAPLEIDGRKLRLAMADPLDYGTLQDVEFRSGRTVVAAVATESAIASLLDRTYPRETPAQPPDDLPESAPEGEVEAGEGAEEAGDIYRLSRDLNLPPVVRLVNVVLSEAAAAGASDIHIEPQDDCLQIRQRVDGLLYDTRRIHKAMQDAVVSRLKIIAGMDIAERRRPQDGRGRLRYRSRRIDLRLSTLPTHHGEKVVVRLLDSANARIEIEKLGFSPDVRRSLQEVLSRPQGLVLVTGPTGSGKTSTLYASLNWLRSATKNIITVEDPVEYELEGINQVQINTKAGVTFASGLRSILRQDPNVVLVGEIRDRETAAIALEAAQTGHLLLSTLHTKDASATITRLLDLGMEPYLVAASLTGVLAQRLVRRGCADCATPRDPARSDVEKAGGAARLPPGAAWRGGRGCDACAQSGYRGRLPVHEILVVTDEIRDLIAARAADHAIRETARRAGMRSLMEDGIGKAAQGLTTLEEIVRVVPPDEPAERPPAGEPQARGTRMEAALAGPPPVAPPAATPGAPAPGGAGRVLVVEDSPIVTSVVKYFLELEGFEVITAPDGVQGLEAARSLQPDVIVSDLNMPGMDGMSLVSALRQDPRTRTAAILLLTSDTSVDSEARGLMLGADDYLAKPVEPRRLAARVKAVLARSQKAQAGVR